MAYLAVALAALAGCAESTACSIPYQPLVVQARTSRYALFEAAQLEARAMGPVEQTPGKLEVGALSGEGELRDRVTIKVEEDGRLAVSVRTEMSDGHGGWVGATGMCEDYQHNRERRIAQAVLGRVVQAEEE